MTSNSRTGDAAQGIRHGEQSGHDAWSGLIWPAHYRNTHVQYIRFVLLSAIVARINHPRLGSEVLPPE